jgi:hypothetical protein
LEERGLSRFHTSVTCWNVNVIWGNGTSSGGRSDLVGENFVTDFLEFAVGENETNIALDERKKTLVLWVVGDEALDGTADLFSQLYISFYLRRFQW